MTFPVSMNENIASPQSPIAPERPKKTVPHVSYRSVDSEIDLEMSSMPPSGTQTPYEGDTISRRVSGEHIRDADGVQQTIWNPYRNRFRVMASCLTCFGNGLNDSAPGALLADIQKCVLKTVLFSRSDFDIGITGLPTEQSRFFSYAMLWASS